MPSDRYWRSDELALLEQCDFFAGDKEDFAASVQNPSCLWQGAHRQQTPFVSVVITTYKRPQWLKVALDSVLAQEGFDDFEIVVVDNECAENLQETETSALMRTFNDEKIIYYRNKISAISRTNTAIACAKTPYICILHDDDFLAPQHLRVMVGVLKAHPEISYLSCKRQSFISHSYDELRADCVSALPGSLTLRNYTCASASIGCYPDWLGALINKEKIVGIGGMLGKISVVTSIGDAIMTVRYMDRYAEIVQCDAGIPLYFYRLSEKQDSALGCMQWANAYAVLLMLYKYINRKYHSRLLPLWNFLSEVTVLGNANGLSLQYANISNFDLNTFRQMSRMTIRDGNALICRTARKIIQILHWYYSEGAMSAFRNSTRALLRRWYRLTGLVSKNAPSGE